MLKVIIFQNFRRNELLFTWVNVNFTIIQNYEAT